MSVDLHDPKRPTVAAVGSPSTHQRVTVDVLGAQATAPLIGAMLYFAQPLQGRTEVALTTVTEVETRNTWAENSTLRGVVKHLGHLPNISGDGDVRTANLAIQAVFASDGPRFVQGGPTLSTSPTTGLALRRLDAEVLDAILASSRDELFYLGQIYRMEDLSLPLSIPHFGTDEGAFHTGIFGITGSGKTQFAALLLGGLMRHAEMGMIVVDPQGQWSNNDLRFDLAAWARRLGRKVIVRRLQTDLRLERDAGVFASLLERTRFFRELAIKGEENRGDAAAEIARFLRDRGGDWTTDDPEDVLKESLEALSDPDALSRIYSTQAKQADVGKQIELGLSNPARFSALAELFKPVHNLFAPTNDAGGKRHSLWGTISAILDRHATPRPLLILDMSGSDAAADMVEAMSDERVQAVILHQLVSKITQAAAKAYRDGEGEGPARLLNTLVLFDEAHRYAAAASADVAEEVSDLAESLVRNVRETRKYGLGWTFVTQTVRSLHSGILAQLSVYCCGYGLTGKDLSIVADQTADGGGIDLYKSFSPPRSTSPRVYPFMLLGPVSPLSITRAPVFLSALADPDPKRLFDRFAALNARWAKPSGIDATVEWTPAGPAADAVEGPLPVNGVTLGAGGMLEIRFRASTEAVADLRKRVPSASYDKADKAWRAPQDAIAAVMAFAERYGLVLGSSVRELAESAEVF